MELINEDIELHEERENHEAARRGLDNYYRAADGTIRPFVGQGNNN